MENQVTLYVLVGFFCIFLFIFVISKAKRQEEKKELPKNEQQSAIAGGQLRIFESDIREHLLEYVNQTPLRFGDKPLKFEQLLHNNLLSASCDLEDGKIYISLFYDLDKKNILYWHVDIKKQQWKLGEELTAFFEEKQERNINYLNKELQESDELCNIFEPFEKDERKFSSWNYYDITELNGYQDTPTAEKAMGARAVGLIMKNIDKLLHFEAFIYNIEQMQKRERDAALAISRKREIRENLLKYAVKAEMEFRNNGKYKDLPQFEFKSIPHYDGNVEIVSDDGLFSLSLEYDNEKDFLWTLLIIKNGPRNKRGFPLKGASLFDAVDEFEDHLDKESTRYFENGFYDSIQNDYHRSESFFENFFDYFHSPTIDEDNGSVHFAYNLVRFFYNPDEYEWAGTPDGNTKVDEKLFVEENIKDLIIFYKLLFMHKTFWTLFESEE